MKKILAKFIFLGIIAAALCSSGLMANILGEGSKGHFKASECCTEETIAHHTEEIDAIMSPLVPLMPAILLVLVSIVLFSFRELQIFQHLHYYYNFHKFSRGVFQLE